jgi:integrase/recombinase XerD
LLATARSLESQLHEATYETLIGLLAVTGMRLGEALGLDRPDVDLTAQLIVIRCGKFSKPRQVPIHLSTAKAPFVCGALERRSDPRLKAD